MNRLPLCVVVWLVGVAAYGQVNLVFDEFTIELRGREQGRAPSTMAVSVGIGAGSRGWVQVNGNLVRSGDCWRFTGHMPRGAPGRIESGKPLLAAMVLRAPDVPTLNQNGRGSLTLAEGRLCPKFLNIWGRTGSAFETFMQEQTLRPTIRGFQPQFGYPEVTYRVEPTMPNRLSLELPVYFKWEEARADPRTPVRSEWPYDITVDDGARQDTLLNLFVETRWGDLWPMPFNTADRATTHGVLRHGASVQDLRRMHALFTTFDLVRFEKQPAPGNFDSPDDVSMSVGVLNWFRSTPWRLTDVTSASRPGPSERPYTVGKGEVHKLALWVKNGAHPLPTGTYLSFAIRMKGGRVVECTSTEADSEVYGHPSDPYGGFHVSTRSTPAIRYRDFGFVGLPESAPAGLPSPDDATWIPIQAVESVTMSLRAARGFRGSAQWDLDDLILMWTPGDASRSLENGKVIAVNLGWKRTLKLSVNTGEVNDRSITFPVRYDPPRFEATCSGITPFTNPFVPFRGGG